MQLSKLDRSALVLDDEGELIGRVKAKDITSRTLDRLIQLFTSELLDRGYKKEDNNNGQQAATGEGVSP